LEDPDADLELSPSELGCPRRPQRAIGSIRIRAVTD